MKYVKFILIIMLFTFLFLSTTSTSKAHAQSPTLECKYLQDEEFWDTTTENCDLALSKKVSVNNSAYASAESPSSAVNAHVGDTVIWQISITNNSSGNLLPYGIVTVQDILPTGVTFVSSNPSTGTYANNNWVFTLTDNLPATLIIMTTANATGLIENIATLTEYDSNECDTSTQVQGDSDPYVDANSTNNSDNAFIDVVTPTPVPTPTQSVITPKAPDTGFGVHLNNPLITLLSYVFGAGSVLASALAIRQKVTRQ